MDNIAEIMGIRLNLVGRKDLARKTAEYMNDDRMDVILFADTGMVMDAADRKTYAVNLREADLGLPAENALFTRKELAFYKERRFLIGQDGLGAILQCLEMENISLYLVGDNEKDMRIFMESLKSLYPGIQITGAYHVEPELREEFKVSDEIIVNEINGEDTDLLVVMMSGTGQEEWIRENKTILRARICIGIGSVVGAYLHTHRSRQRGVSLSVFRKLHYYMVSGLKLMIKHKRRIFQKRIAQYNEENKDGQV